MPEHIMGPSKTVWNINESGIAPVYVSGIPSFIGSVAITNAHIDVDIDVADHVSVTQSGAYIVTLGSTNINNVITGSVVQKTSPWIVLGSQAITNVLTGSCVQSTNPWIVLGSQAITNVITGSVVQKTSPWVVLGSQAITNVLTGSVVQSTNPWVVLGSTCTTNPPYLGSTYYISGIQDVREQGCVTNEQLTFTAGSLNFNTHKFTGGVVKSLLIKCEKATYVKLDSGATANSFLIDAGQSLSIDANAGSVTTLHKAGVGSVWVWGVR